MRLRDLCLKLDVSNDLRRKIWTCFEFTLVHCADLMKDRHLDQLLLCAFYIMAKVMRSFKELREFYVNWKCKLCSQFTVWLLYSCHIVGGKGRVLPRSGWKSQHIFSLFCIISKVPISRLVTRVFFFSSALTVSTGQHRQSGVWSHCPMLVFYPVCHLHDLIRNLN